MSLYLPAGKHLAPAGGGRRAEEAERSSLAPSRVLRTYSNQNGSAGFTAVSTSKVRSHDSRSTARPLTLPCLCGFPFSGSSGGGGAPSCGFDPSQARIHESCEGGGKNGSILDCSRARRSPGRGASWQVPTSLHLNPVESILSAPLDSPP